MTIHLIFPSITVLFFLSTCSTNSCFNLLLSHLPNISMSIYLIFPSIIILLSIYYYLIFLSIFHFSICHCLSHISIYLYFIYSSLFHLSIYHYLMYLSLFNPSTGIHVYHYCKEPFSTLFIQKHKEHVIQKQAEIQKREVSVANRSKDNE